MNRVKHGMWPVLVLALVLLAGCAAKQPAQADWMYPKQVTFEEVRPLVTVPNPEGVMIIDARPYETKHVQGYIPTSVSIPDSKFEAMVDKLPKDKNTRLIYYCEGWECKLSHKSAFKAEKLGYKNVQVFGGGYPEWVAKGEVPAIGVEQLKDMMAKGEPYMLIDSRPAVKFAEGAIPSAVSIPDSAFDKLSGVLPRDKNVALVFYCGGFDCPLSHKSAAKARAMGYKKIMIAEAGYPAWAKMYGGGAAAPKAQAKADDGALDQAQFEKLMKDNAKGVLLVDVRDDAEFKAGHMTGALNIPVDQLEKKAAGLPKDKSIVFVCATGARSGEAYYMMKDKRPELKVHYLEATTKYKKDGSYEMKSNKK